MDRRGGRRYNQGRMHKPDSVKPLFVRSVFLDRDGTVIEDKSYLGNPAGVAILPGAGDGLARLAARGLSLFIVTNQSGIGRGYFSLDDYLACRAELNRILAVTGSPLTDEAFCPHDPDAGCSCRKPALGMWHELRARHNLEARECMIVGDKTGDLEFGYAAGFALSALVLTGEGEKTAARLGVDLPPTGAACLETVDKAGRPLLLARDLKAVADWLLPRLAASASALS